MNSLRHCIGCHGEFFADELDAFECCEDCAREFDSTTEVEEDEEDCE